MPKSIKKLPGGKKLFLFFLILGCFAFSSVVLALEVGWPASPMGTDIMQLDKDDKLNLAVFIKYLYEWGIALGGVATFVAFVIAGFQYITSVGNPQTMKDAVERIKSAMFGLVMLLSSFVILNTINDELTTFKLDFDQPQDINNFFDECSEGDKGKCKSEQGYECVITDPAAGKGVCMPAAEKEIICSKAQICSETDFHGSCEIILPDQVIQGDPPKSVRAFFKDPDDNYTEKRCDLRQIDDPYSKTSSDKKRPKKQMGDYSGCGCFLQLLAKRSSWFWSECGDKITDVPAYETDLTRWADKEFYCVKLIVPKKEEVK